jgi:hypothetical protein
VTGDADYMKEGNKSVKENSSAVILQKSQEADM